MNVRQLNILHQFLSAANYLTAQDLSANYSVSTKTIYHDIDLINEALESFFVRIKRTPRKGIILDANREEREELYKTFYDQQLPLNSQTISPEMREAKIVKELIFGSGKIDIIDWSLLNYVSEVSVRRDIEKLETKLADYSLYFERKSGEIRLVGCEQNIRKFARNYLLYHYVNQFDKILQCKELQTIFSLSEIKMVIEKVDSYSYLYHFNLNESYKLFLIFDLLIARHRFHNKKILTEVDKILSKNIKGYEVFLFSGDLLSSILELEINQIPENEIVSIVYSLLSVGYESAQVVYNHNMSRIVEQFILNVGHLISLDLSSDNYLRQMLLNHVQPMIFRLKNKIIIENQIVEEIKTQYSILYNVVWISSKILNEQFNIVLNDAEVAFLTIHFEIAIEKLIQPLTVYVVCPHNLATSELIMSQLRRIISDYDHLIKVELSDLPKIKLKETDLLISSVHLDLPHTRYILVGTIIKDQELQEIQRQYYRFSKSNRSMVSLLRNNNLFSQSLIKKLLNHSIYLHCQFTSVEECLNYLIKQSHKANLSKPQYEKSIWKREELGNTSTYTGVALPHADPEFVSHSQLLMMTLDKPILWGNNYVKVVMLVAIESRDLKAYVDALVSIYSKIDSFKYIDDLWQSDEKEVFLSHLFSEVTYD
ncbi:BglG family transcription antiterminator [Streptococcus dentiloxodontae]